MYFFTFECIHFLNSFKCFIQIVILNQFTYYNFKVV